MLLDLPVELLHSIVWRYCAVPDSIRIDYNTVRAMRLTCRAFYNLLDDCRRWSAIARYHYAAVKSLETFVL